MFYKIKEKVQMMKHKYLVKENGKLGLCFVLANFRVESRYISVEKITTTFPAECLDTLFVTDISKLREHI